MRLTELYALLAANEAAHAASRCAFAVLSASACSTGNCGRAEANVLAAAFQAGADLGRLPRAARRAISDALLAAHRRAVASGSKRARGCVAALWRVLTDRGLLPRLSALVPRRRGDALNEVECCTSGWQLFLGEVYPRMPTEQYDDQRVHLCALDGERQGFLNLDWSEGAPAEGDSLCRCTWMVNLSTQVRPAAAQMLWVPQKSPAREEKVQTALRLDPARWHPRNGFHSHFLAGAPHLQDPYLPAMAELKLVDSSGDDNPFDAPYLVLLALCLPPPPASGERAAKRRAL